MPIGQPVCQAVKKITAKKYKKYDVMILNCNNSAAPEKGK
jgi:hypothetical protein